MKTTTTQLRDHASAAYVSELDYATSMYFSAAHLPGGSSQSLVAESNPVGTTLSFDHVASSVQLLVDRRKRRIAMA